MMFIKVLIWDVKETIINLYNQNFDFVITFKENEVFALKNKERWFSPMDRSLRRELKSCFWKFVLV